MELLNGDGRCDCLFREVVVECGPRTMGPATSLGGNFLACGQGSGRRQTPCARCFLC